MTTTDAVPRAPCPNPRCKCPDCTCGEQCTCMVSTEVVCDPCVAFKKSKEAEAGARNAASEDTVDTGTVRSAETAEEALFGTDDEEDVEDAEDEAEAPPTTVPVIDKYVSMEGLYHGLGELSLEDIPKRKELYDLLISDFPTKRGKASSTFERLSKNDRRMTLVYGEISFNSFAFTMEKIKNQYGGLSKPGGIFYDIGHGTGKPAMAAALCHDFDEVKGIEILNGLYDISLALKQAWNDVVTPLVPERKANTKITFIHGDATVLDWSDATCCFANSTCFDDDLMKILALKADALPTGTFFITFTKRLPSEKWEVLEQESHPQSWGPATIYIHQKRPSYA